MPIGVSLLYFFSPVRLVPNRYPVKPQHLPSAGASLFYSLPLNSLKSLRHTSDVSAFLGEMQTLVHVLGSRGPVCPYAGSFVLRGAEHETCKIPDSHYERAKTLELCRCLHVDFCSGFGTVFQGIRRLLSLSRACGRARAKRTHGARTPQAAHGMADVLHAANSTCISASQLSSGILSVSCSTPGTGRDGLPATRPWRNASLRG